ncbi:MAG: hypothetical protein KatS3mg105_3568 [Gemmatales bacterium]|nr:MAG: hypothetical protein KatS3mg105_3568 [Gemmatales bacterium]
MKILQWMMVVVPLFSLGCDVSGRGSATKLTVENFLKIKAGMNHQEVTLILGQPTEKEESEELGMRMWRWREGNKEITIFFDEWGNVMFNGTSAFKVQKGLE